MLIPAEEDKLGETRNATLILRLVLDRRGHLKYGELVDATNGFHERFVQWRGLIRNLRTWFTSQAASGAGVPGDQQPPV